MSSGSSGRDIERLSMSEWSRFLNGHSAEDGLVKLALEDVQKSGLSTEAIEMAGIQIFRGGIDDLKEHLGRAKVNGHSLIGDFRLIEFPYFNKESEIVFYRYKVVPTTTDQNGNEIKYLHPIGRSAIPYILPFVWAVKDKPHKPVWITEGEKKALKLIQHGRYAIALSGVWNFKAGKNSDELDSDKSLWAELESFEWHGRTVYMAFDNDLWTNPRVREALYELALKLFERKAIVRIAQW